MNLEKQKAFLIHVLYIVVILLLVYIGIKYLLPLLMPFVVGVVIAVAFRHPIDKIVQKTHIKRGFVSVLILIIFYGLIGFIISLIGFKVFNFLLDLFDNLPTLYETSIQPAIRSGAENLMINFPVLKVYLSSFLDNIGQSIFTFLTNTSSTIIGTITSIAGQLPSLLINFVFTIVASFFFTIDYYRITRFIMRQFNAEHREVIINLKDNGIGTLGKFFKAYATIISVTFLELSIGFWIIGIPNPLLFGGLISIIDVMPILGTGAVLIPWSVIAFVLGNTRIGVGMLVLYIVITIVRQTIEPRIVGQQIGLHPLVTLLLMFVGTQLMAC